LEVFYASHFGHTGKIAQSLARYISISGVPAYAYDLTKEYPSKAQIQSLEPCVLISAVRYGVHLYPARKLLKQMAPLTPRKPLILLSVNLTARKEGKTSATGNLYLRKWISRSGARPLLAEAIAGNLQYPRYNAFDRTMIRLIMSVTGGPTDGNSVIDYTPWAHVADLANRIGEAIREVGGINPIFPENSR